MQHFDVIFQWIFNYEMSEEILCYHNVCHTAICCNNFVNIKFTSAYYLKYENFNSFGSTRACRIHSQIKL